MSTAIGLQVCHLGSSLLKYSFLHLLNPTLQVFGSKVNGLNKSLKDPSQTFHLLYPQGNIVNSLRWNLDGQF